jgi:hypothetical protein
MGLNTGCWTAGKTYTMSPITGLVVSMFLQPGGNAYDGYSVAWAAENVLNVAINVIVTFIRPESGGQTTVTMVVTPGSVTPTNTWIFPEGASNFQLAAISQ